jgi:hypothetical protein
MSTVILKKFHNLEVQIGQLFHVGHPLVTQQIADTSELVSDLVIRVGLSDSHHTVA